MKFKKLRKVNLVICLISILGLNGCGDDNDSSPANKLPVATEQAMSEDNTVALSSERNAVLYLQDPDDESLTRDWFSTMEEKIKAATSKARLALPEAGHYQICQEYPEHMDHRIQIILTDSSGNELLSSTDEGCKSVEIAEGAQNLFLGVAKLSDQIAEESREPAFLTMDGNTITMSFNHCIGCDLNGLDLTGKHLVGTDLTGSDLTNAKIKDTKLSFVHLDDSKGLFENGLTAAMHHAGDFEQIAQRGLWHVVTHPKETADKAVHKVKHVAKDISDHVIHITDDFVLKALDQGVEEDGGDLNIHNVSFAKSVKAMRREIVNPPLADVVYHTYLELDGYNNEKYAWGAFGHNSGGELLAGTETSCANDSSCIDSHTIAYMMHEPPCRWPTAGYAQVGVCWNLTNRGLYYTGKTVKNVPYYAVIEGIYGTYGGDHAASADFAVAPFTMNSCLEAQETFAPWHGHDFGSLSSSSINRNITEENANPRIELYQKYRKNIEDRSVSQDNQNFEYLQELFRLNMTENLANIDEATVNKLLSIHEKYFYEFKSLDSSDQSDYTSQFNGIMNDKLSEIKTVLGEEDYLRFMNLDQEEAFDLGEIL